MKRPATTPRKQRGQSMLEFTFVGIPLMFVLISIFEISRGMWMYHTLAYSVKDGVRFAAVHGINCVNTTGSGGTNPNSCTKTIADITQQINSAAVGVVANQTTLTFIAADNSQTKCDMSGTAITGTDCSKLSAVANIWPPNGVGNFNGVGQRIRIDVNTTFGSALAMFWPGSSPVHFGKFNLGASSTDYVQFWGSLWADEKQHRVDKRL
jgi:hypothetical protein